MIISFFGFLASIPVFSDMNTSAWFISALSSLFTIGIVGLFLAIIDMVDITRDNYVKDGIHEELEEKFERRPPTPISPAHTFQPHYYAAPGEQRPVPAAQAKPTPPKKPVVIRPDANSPPRRSLSAQEEAEILKQVEADDRARFNKSGDEKPPTS